MDVIMRSVVVCCTSWLFSRVSSVRRDGSGISSTVTSHGPNAPVPAPLAICFQEAGSVAHQAAGGDEPPEYIARRNCVAHRQGGEAINSAAERGVAGDHQRANALAGNWR